MLSRLPKVSMIFSRSPVELIFSAGSSSVNSASHTKIARSREGRETTVAQKLRDRDEPSACWKDCDIFLCSVSDSTNAGDDLFHNDSGSNVNETPEGGQLAVVRCRNSQVRSCSDSFVCVSRNADMAGLSKLRFLPSKDRTSVVKPTNSRWSCCEITVAN